MGQGYGAGLGLWGRAMGQAWSCLCGFQTHRCGALWVGDVGRAVGQRCGVRPPDVGRYGSPLSVRPPDQQIWGSLWVRPGAMGLEWSYGAGLGLWGRPGAVGQEWSYGAGLGLWGRPGPMGQGYGAGLGLWGRAMGQDWGYGAGLELPVRPPDPHMWGAMDQAWGYGAGLGLWGRTGAVGQD